MWTYPKVVAHRGAGILAPENTLAAMQCGLARGFRAVEFDVMLSKDSVPVLMHDPEFGRTVQNVGQVSDTLASDLFNMDAGSWLSAQFKGVNIPSYEEVFLFCQANRIWMNVEIKPAPGFEMETGRVVANITTYLLSNLLASSMENELQDKAIMPLFSSFDYDALMSAKQAAPHIPRGFLTDVIESNWLSRLRQLDAVSLHTNHNNLTPSLAAEIKQAGFGLFCYTVNTPERAKEILAWGVDGFCTDRIDLIAADF